MGYKKREWRFVEMSLFCMYLYMNFLRGMIVCERLTFEKTSIGCVKLLNMPVC